MAYFSVDEYRAAFGKGVPPRTDEERQEAALRALEYLANEDFDAAATGGALPPREGERVNREKESRARGEPCEDTYPIFVEREPVSSRSSRTTVRRSQVVYVPARRSTRALSSSRPSNARRIFRRVGSSEGSDRRRVCRPVGVHVYGARSEPREYARRATT